ncbi:MAG: glycosyltransferase [Burkholderiales bacterium]|nr:glycosyltransferase [Bacteroidia bacterium]
MPKVLRIINRFNIGGITYNVSYLSKYLEPDYETLLVGGPEEEGEDSSLYIPEGLGLKPRVLKQFQREINFKADYKAYKEIKKIISEFKPDIVHTHASKAGAIGRLAAIHCKVPIIIHTFHGHVFHSYFGKFKTGFYKIIERYFARHSTAIIAISNKQKLELLETFHIAPKEKIHVVPLGFDLTRFTLNIDQNRKQFRTKYNLKDDQLAIGIIGRLAPIKNHSLFIEAIAYLKENGFTNFKGFIIGDGDTRDSITEACRINNISWSNEPSAAVDVIFTSWITNVEWALHGLDIVTLTSLNEGTPVSIIEAQAAGKYVVATNVGGIEDILHPNCGLLSCIDDKKSFMDNLLTTCVNKVNLSTSADKGREWALSKFSYSRLVTDMRDLYSQLLNRT